MATSMDFPVSKKKNNLDNSRQNEYKLEIQDKPSEPSTITIERGPKGDTGPQGPQGPQGIPGPKGDTGRPGRDGIDGKDGRDGRDGRDGKDGLNGKMGLQGQSMLSPSGQNIGWALYGNSDIKPINIGPTRGDDGWVSLIFAHSSDNLNEDFLPKDNVSLYNKESQVINLKGVKIGSIITIRYDVDIITFNNNTDIWFRSLLSKPEISPVTFAGSLKYQSRYPISMEHTFFVEDMVIRNKGALPQIYADNDATLFIKSLYVSVS